MLNTKLGYIKNEGMAYDGKDFWLIERNSNWICRLSGQDMKYRYIRRLPERVSDRGLATNNVGIIYDSHIYCIPLRTSNLWIYNIDNDNFEKITLPRNKNINPYISGYWMVDGYLWLAGCRGEIWKVSVENSKEISYFNFGEKLSGDFMGGGFWCDGSSIFGTDNNIGVVIKFDLQDGLANTIDVDKKINGFNSLYKCGNILFLSGRDGYLYEYSLNDVSYTKMRLPNETRKCDNNWFIQSFLYNDMLILCPWLPDAWERNVIVVFDIKRKESFVIDESEGGDNVFLYGYFKNGKLYFGFEKKDDLYIYNFDEMIINTIKCEKLNRKSRNLDMISEGIVYEGEKMSICDFFDCL